MMMNAVPSKGKQATKGQKQIHEENLNTIKYYSMTTVCSSVLYFALAFFLLHTSNYEWVGYWLTVSLQFGCIFMMKKMAKVTKNDKDQVLDAGLDLNMEGGFSEYCKDIAILSIMIQIASIFWSKCWLFLLMVSINFEKMENATICQIPAFAVFKLWVFILAPWFFAAPPIDDENEDKKAKKRERKLRRMQ